MSRSAGPIRSVSDPNVNSGNNTTTSQNNGFMAQSGSLGSTTNPPIDALLWCAPATSTAGNLVTCTSVAFGQPTTITLQDPGVSAANFSLAGSGSVWNQVTVTLTPTQMAAAYATPVMLIPAPAASQAIIVHSATVYVASTGNTAYATGTAPIIQYSTGGTNGAHGAGTIATASGLVAGDITASTSQIRTLFQPASAAITGISGYGISFSNATGAYTGGTGTNVTITLVYELLTATV